MKRLIPFSFLFLVFWTGCKTDEPIDPMPDEDIHPGGNTSVEGAFTNIFQLPAANLNSEEQAMHFQADAAFGAQYVTAPAAFQSGLGPLFNQNSCESCHVANGRSPFPENGDDLRGLLFRVSIPGMEINGGNLPAPGFGLQLQTKANFGKQPEVKLSIQEITEIVQYVDGTQVALHKPVYVFVDPYLQLPEVLEVSPRIAPPIIGLGLLEAIRASDIQALADENDADSDGISGRPNYVWDIRQHQTVLGRFGWKASQPDLYQQTAAAFSGDMGITSPLFITENCAGQIQDDGLTDDAEIDDATVALTAFYSQSLGVPIRRNWADGQVRRGKQLFFDLKCASCHHDKFVTGEHQYGFLSNQTIFPYTDMLLHDMGEGLADHRPDFKADGREWRTPPLWGIGLTELVGGHTRFLHDGRARSLEEAILWHGGEAADSQQQFRNLSKTDRDAIVDFLNSL